MCTEKSTDSVYWTEHSQCVLNRKLTVQYWTEHWQHRVLHSAEQITDSYTVYFINWQYLLNRALSHSTLHRALTVFTEQSTVIQFSTQSSDSIYWTEHCHTVLYTELWQYLVNGALSCSTLHRALTVFTEQSTVIQYSTQSSDSIYWTEHCHTVLYTEHLQLHRIQYSTEQSTSSVYWTQYWQFCSVLYVLNRKLRAAQCAVQYVTEQFHLVDISAIIRFLTPGGSEINGRPWQKLGTYF